MPFLNAGVLAAVATLVSWTASALLFERASLRVGSLPVNVIRMVMCVGFFAVTLAVTRGSPIPTDLPAEAWLWLSISGLIGFCLGDLCLFRAYVEIGPRLTMLVMALVPPITAIIEFFATGARYDLLQWIGMAITVAGVAWVVSLRESNGEEEGQGGDADDQKLHVRKVTLVGLLLAFGATVGQAAGMVTIKLGMGDSPDYDPFAMTQIRAIAGTAGFLVIFTFAGWWPAVWRSFADRRAMLLTTAGSFVGPFIGASLLVVAIAASSPGVAATIVALIPIALIPPAILLDREKVSLWAVLGTLVAVAGVYLLVR